MSLPYKHTLIPRAKELRKEMTPQERHLWYDFLRTYPVRFQRQKTISGFIVDFYCHQARLAIELDGGQHHTEQGLAYDMERTNILEKYRLQVLRFTNSDVDQHFRAVCEEIDREIRK